METSTEQLGKVGPTGAILARAQSSRSPPAGRLRPCTAFALNMAALTATSLKQRWCRPLTGTSTEQPCAGGPTTTARMEVDTFPVARSSKSPQPERFPRCTVFALNPTVLTETAPRPGWCKPPTGTSTGQPLGAGPTVLARSSV